MSTSASLAIDADAILGAIATISSSVSMLADADAILSAVAILSIAASVSALGGFILGGDVSIAASAALSALGVKVVKGEVSISAVSELDLTALAYVTKTMGFDGTLTAGDVLIIDTDAQTVELNGVNATRYFTGMFWKLFTETSTIRWKDDDAGRTAELKVEHEPRWL